MTALSLQEHSSDPGEFLERLEADRRPPCPHTHTHMAIIINIDVMLAKRKMSVTELAEKVGITMANISILKNGKARAIRFSHWRRSARRWSVSPAMF